MIKELKFLNSLIEHFNCGIGSDGFQTGNTCAKGGSTQSLSISNSTTKEEFESRALSEEESSEIIKKIRAGDEKSKNRGATRYEKTSKLVLSRIPLSVFTEEYREFLQESTDSDRVESYSKQNIDTPIYTIAKKKRGGSGISVSVSDGGHRLMAAIKRGDTHINSYVPVDSFDSLKEKMETKEHFQLLDDLIEYFDHSTDNCGIGSKGFERGNECAKGGKGVQSQADARKAVKAAQKVVKTPGKVSTGQSSLNPSKTNPSPSGPSDSAVGGTKEKKSSRSIADLGKSETIKAHADSIMKGNVPPKQEIPSDRAAKALAAHKPVTNDMKAIAKEREQDIAKGLGGNWLSDHEPVDVVVGEGKSTVGIEVKTVFENTRGSLTIDPAANFNKVNWTKSNKGARIDIVVYDDKNKIMYYKRGVGSFSIDAMHKITGGMEELKKLVSMKETDKKFPEKASYQTSTVYHNAVSDPEAYKTLQERALKSFLDKEIRRTRSKEKMKAGN